MNILIFLLVLTIPLSFGANIPVTESGETETSNDKVDEEYDDIDDVYPGYDDDDYYDIDEMYGDAEYYQYDDDYDYLGDCIEDLKPSYIRFKEFDTICRSLDTYLPCYEEEVRQLQYADSDNEFGIHLYLDALSTIEAYTQTCNQLATDSQHTKRLAVCVNFHIEELQGCNEKFATSMSGDPQDSMQAANQVICDALFERAYCEIEVLQRCNKPISAIIEYFHNTALPSICKNTISGAGPQIEEEDYVYLGLSLHKMNCSDIFLSYQPDPSSGEVASSMEMLCSKYEELISCISAHLSKHQYTPAPVQFHAESQIAAFRNFCPVLPDIKNDMKCLDNDTAASVCRDQLPYRMSLIENSTEMSKIERETTICRALTDQVVCEYRSHDMCNTHILDTVTSFFMESLSPRCLELTGLTAQRVQENTTPSKSSSLQTFHTFGILLLLMNLLI